MNGDDKSTFDIEERRDGLYATKLKLETLRQHFIPRVVVTLSDAALIYSPWMTSYMVKRDHKEFSAQH